MADAYEDLSTKPLFGEARPRERLVNLVVGGLTSVLVLATVLSAIIYGWPPKASFIYLSVCIVFVSVSHSILIYWYRQGDLEPKFRTLIYFNTLIIIMLCVAAWVLIFKWEK